MLFVRKASYKYGATLRYVQFQKMLQEELPL